VYDKCHCYWRAQRSIVAAMLPCCHAAMLPCCHAANALRLQNRVLQRACPWCAMVRKGAPPLTSTRRRSGCKREAQAASISSLSRCARPMLPEKSTMKASSSPHCARIGLRAALLLVRKSVERFNGSVATAVSRRLTSSRTYLLHLDIEQGYRT
jgi:hypothetical protein